jgi:alpha-methylacyl-CoA racemase
LQLDASAWPEVKKLLAETFLTKTRDQWAELFADSDACVSPVLSPWEAHHHPHNKSRSAFVDVGGMVQPAPAPRFSRTPAIVPRAMDAGGRDIGKTLRDWGLSADEVAKLEATASLA